jgi:hypothetical protein
VVGDRSWSAGGGNIFVHLHVVHTDSAANPVSYPEGMGGTTAGE